MLKQTLTAHILNNLRILKSRNPGDTYYEEYLKHAEREGEEFYDQYSFAICRVISNYPKRILEIGVRTGLSICNMLSAYKDYRFIEKIVLCDIWNDGFCSPEIVSMNIRAMNFPPDVVNKIHFLKGDSKVEVPKLEGEFDYVLVDGDHNPEMAMIDLKNCVRLVAPGGILVMDDLSPFGCNLLSVWEKFKEIYKDQFNFDQNLSGKGTGWMERR